MKKLLLFLATVAVATSCEKEIISDVAVDSNESKQITVSASTEGVATRVSVTGNEAKGFDVEWLETDKLGGWAWNGPSSNDDFNEFTIAKYEDYGATNSAFSGSISNAADDSNVRFIHPYTTVALNESETISGKPYYYGFDINLSAQKAGALNSNTYMISNTVSYADVETAQLSMSHIGAMMELNFKAIEGYTLTSVVVKDIPAIASIDLREEEDYLAKTVNSDVTITDVESNTVAFNILPFTVEKDEILTVVSYYTKDEVVYSAETVITASKDVEFARATRNSVNVLVEESDLVAAVAPKSVFTLNATTEDFPSESSSVEELVVVNDATLAIKEAYINTKYNSFSFGKNSAGYIYNLTAFEGVSKIVVTEDYEHYNLTIYEGTELNPSANEVEYTKEGNDYIYTISADSKYFTIVNESTYNASADVIKIYYDALGETASIFTGLNPEGAVFDCDDTTAQTITINGVNIAKEDVSVDVDSDKFEVSAVSDDLTFTVAPVAANTTAVANTATVTVTVGTVEYTVAVSQRGDVQLTETKLISSDFKSGKYTANDGIGIYKGITLNVNNCYLQSESIQMAKSSQDPGGLGALYNTVALNGLAEIVVDVKTNEVVVYAGTAENPSTEVSGVDGIYSIPAGCKYFKITATSKYAQVNSITFKYESIEGGSTTPDQGSEATIVAADFGLANAKDVETTTLSGYTFSFAGTVSNSAKYYSSGNGSIRYYTGDVMTIESADGSNITSIVFVTDGEAAMTTTVGTMDQSKKTWTGSASSIEFKASETVKIESFTISK